MKLEAEVIKANWEKLMEYINIYITGPRKQQLLDFYSKHEDKLIMMPAAIKKEYHSAYAGGYIHHVNNVVSSALKMKELWEGQGADVSTFTMEELVFSAINHDLGKMGDGVNESYIPQTDKWRQEKLGEVYTFNKVLAFASVPDRSLFLLQEAGIKYSFNEMLAIQVHDGLYDEANKKYLMSYSAETKPRTNLLYILHQADLMAARIEFEQDWAGEFSKDKLEAVKEVRKLNTTKTGPQKALSSVGSKSLSSFLDKIVE